jgi:hypothetical protein
VFEHGLKKNAYLKLPKEHEELLADDERQDAFVKQTHEAYMIKLQYECYPDSSDVNITDEEAEKAPPENEEDLKADEP